MMPSPRHGTSLEENGTFGILLIGVNDVVSTMLKNHSIFYVDTYSLLRHTFASTEEMKDAPSSFRGGAAR